MYRLVGKRLVCSPAELDLGGLVDCQLSMSPQCALAAKRAKCMLGCIKHNMANQLKEVITPALVQPHLDTMCCFGLHNKNIKIERVQRRATKMAKRLEGMNYEERMRFVQLREDDWGVTPLQSTTSS